MKNSTLTERGQVSVPAELRRAMQLRPGQRLFWEKVSDREMRVTVELDPVSGPMAALGYARKFQNKPRSTAAWMEEIRQGENP